MSSSEIKLQALRLLGRGAFGLVWKMRVTEQCPSSNFGSHVAVKELLSTTRKRKKELYILTAASQASASVIELHCHFATESRVFYCMECFGVALSEILESERQRKSLDIQSIFCCVMQALRDIHAIGVVHRDVKPQNIMVDLATNRAKLIDFGSATNYHKEDNKNIGFAPVVGTLQYRAPELLFASQSYGEKVDLWSAGCVLGEMLQIDSSMPPGPFFPAETECDLFLRFFFCLGAPTYGDILSITMGCSTSSRELLLSLISSVSSPCANVRAMDVSDFQAEGGEDKNMHVSAQQRRLVLHFGVDLLRLLLVYDPLVRISAEEALLTSPFCQEQIKLR